MDHVFKNISEKQISQIAKKDYKLLIEIQKDIHSQKAIYYQKLKTFYWIISICLLVAIIFTVIAMQKELFWLYGLLVLISLIMVLSGGKLYLVDKPEITKKAIAKSKLLDAMEIEILSPSDISRKKKALILIIISGLLYLLAYIIIIVNK